MNNKNIEMFKRTFNLLIVDYGFSFSCQVSNNIYGAGQYELKSNYCTFKLLRDRDQCSMIFWPSFCSEENALSLGWLYDYYKYLEREKNNSSDEIHDYSFPESVDYVVFEKCIGGHYRRLMIMKSFLLENRYEWWDDAREYVNKRIKNIMKKYERKSR